MTQKMFSNQKVLGLEMWVHFVFWLVNFYKISWKLQLQVQVL